MPDTLFLVLKTALQPSRRSLCRRFKLQTNIPRANKDLGV